MRKREKGLTWIGGGGGAGAGERAEKGECERSDYIKRTMKY